MTVAFIKGSLIDGGVKITKESSIQRKNKKSKEKQK